MTDKPTLGELWSRDRYGEVRIGASPKMLEDAAREQCAVEMPRLLAREPERWVPVPWEQVQQFFNEAQQGNS